MKFRSDAGNLDVKIKIFYTVSISRKKKEDGR